MKKMRRMMNKKGFTLIELIVVLAILGVILAIAVPNYTGLQDEAQRKADRSTAALIIKSARLMQVNEGHADVAATLGAMTGQTGTPATVDVAVNGVEGSMTYFDAEATDGTFTLKADTTDTSLFSVEVPNGNADFIENESVNE